MRFLTYDQLKARGIPWGRDQLRRKEKDRSFPAHVQLSPQRIAWVEDEIETYVEQLAAQRTLIPADTPARVGLDETGATPRPAHRDSRRRPPDRVTEEQTPTHA